MEQQYILEMQHITKDFPGVRALDDVHLCIRSGTVHSLMGENGAGKSTLMKCLFGIYRHEEGQIMLGGQPVRFENTSQALAHGIYERSFIMLPLKLAPLEPFDERIEYRAFSPVC